LVPGALKIAASSTALGYSGFVDQLLPTFQTPLPPFHVAVVARADEATHAASPAASHAGR
jgi:hypothetical protein